MPEANKFREPVPTIPDIIMPDEPMTSPSGFKALDPSSVQIPEEIKEMISRVIESERGNVEVRRIDSDTTVVDGEFLVVPGGDTPIVTISRVVYTDGNVTASTVRDCEKEILEDRPENSPDCVWDMAYAVATTIEGANHIAVVKYSTGQECGNGHVLAEKTVTVHARSPRSVYNYIQELEKGIEQPE